ncbi:MAG: glycosyltransferase family 2 protein [Planctomycetota bacterium]|nr:glycosyltransferase family 2 protein [Planctomycetota bacterium]
MSDSVSILVLAHNKAAYTTRCLQALRASSLRPFSVVLVNNGSTDETAQVFETFKAQGAADGIGVEIVTLATNTGAIVGRNQGMERLKGDYWVFLDNDAVLCTRSWLQKLRAVLQGDHKIGAVSPKLIYPTAPHDIQCAGCAVTKGGQVIFEGRGDARTDPKWNVPRDCQTLISACWMMPAAVAKQVGALDERFSPVQFEDIDYCYRIREAGYRCVYEPSVELYHFENVTTGRTGAINYPYLTVKNGLKFKEKWRHRFSQEPGPDDKDWKWREIASVSIDDVPATLAMKD